MDFGPALVIVMMLVPAIAHATDAPPMSWEGFKSLLPILLIACLGGVVSFIGKVRSGDARPFNISEFVGEMLISGFSGTLAYWLCTGMGINAYVTAFVVGISGHLGGRGIFMFEKWAEQKLNDLGLMQGKK